MDLVIPKVLNNLVLLRIEYDFHFLYLFLCASVPLSMKKYQPIIQYCLQQQYKRMDELLKRVPEDIDLDKEPDALEAAQAIWAIEEEWIVDPKLREQLTMLTTYE